MVSHFVCLLLVWHITTIETLNDHYNCKLIKLSINYNKLLINIIIITCYKVNKSIYITIVIYPAHYSRMNIIIYYN